MTLRVHFNRLRDSEFLDLLKPQLAQDIIVTIGEEKPDPADFEILIHPSPTMNWIENSPYLRAIVIPWAGISQEVFDLMGQYPNISLHNLHHNNFNTAELGFSLLLAAAKNLIPMDQALRKNDWSTRFTIRKAVLLRGKTALILGFGEIGQALASYCLGLGMKVKATRKHPERKAAPKDVEIYPHNQLHQILPMADVLLIALPLTGETNDLIGKEELRLMPKGSILVNIGRGSIVNQFALYDALKTGHLTAAGSDVWYNYPESKEAHANTPPADVPFGELENFVLSPHRGGMVEEVDLQRAQALADMLNTANQGLPIPNRVDLTAGY